jgi:hypothetical protein
MATLAYFFDRFGSYEAAATLSGYAKTSFATNYMPEAEATITHLREVLGDEAYASWAERGAGMTPAAIAKYALDQIDGVRAELGSAAGDSR